LHRGQLRLNKPWPQPFLTGRANKSRRECDGDLGCAAHGCKPAREVAMAPPREARKAVSTKSGSRIRRQGVHQIAMPFVRNFFAPL
jgi:hypothetical protein